MIMMGGEEEARKLGSSQATSISAPCARFRPGSSRPGFHGCDLIVSAVRLFSGSEMAPGRGRYGEFVIPEPTYQHSSIRESLGRIKRIVSLAPEFQAPHSITRRGPISSDAIVRLPFVGGWEEHIRGSRERPLQRNAVKIQGGIGGGHYDRLARAREWRCGEIATKLNGLV